MSRLKVYGIKSCDTCRKALRWLEAEGKPHDWHDVRADALAPDQLRRWMAAVGPEALVNRRSTTWRNLSEAEKLRAGEQAGALSLLQAHPTLIKRPVFERGDTVMVGFNETVKQAL